MSIRIQQVPASRGLNWLKRAIKIFLSGPHYLFLPIIIFFMILMIAASIVSVILTGILTALTVNNETAVFISSNVSSLLLSIFTPILFLQIYLISEHLANNNYLTRESFFIVYSKIWQKIKSTLQPLLVLGAIYAILALVFSISLDYYTKDLMTALTKAIETDEGINLQKLPEVNTLAIFTLMTIFTIMQSCFAMATVFIYKAKSIPLQALFYACYLFLKNWLPIIVSYLAYIALMVLVVMLAIVLNSIAAFLSIIPFVLLIGLAVASVTCNYLYIEDCLIIE